MALKKKTERANRPSISEIEAELGRLSSKRRRNRSIKYILGISAVAAAVIIIATNIWLPVLRVVGTSMQPRLQNDDVVVCLSANNVVERGDVIAFYNNDSILLKRVVAIEGDVVEIDGDGILTVNGEVINEPYVLSRSLEPCDITFPIEVSDDSFFVLGDQRSTSMDSRTEAVGMVSRDRIIGKVLLRVWPLERFGDIDS